MAATMMIISSKIPSFTYPKITPNNNLHLPAALSFYHRKLSSQSHTYVTSLSTSPPPSPSRLIAYSTTAGLSNNIADTLADVTIYKASGQPVIFKDLLDPNQGISVVALLRHFGCVCCWEFAAELREAKTTFDSAGVKLIAVGVGTPDKARLLAERLPFPLDCLYADPERKAYDVLGLYYGFGRTFFNPASTKVFSRFESLKKAMKNYTIEATPEDRSGVLQQGGMFVFKGNELLFARKEEGTGDHASLNDIFDICCKVPVA